MKHRENLFDDSCHMNKNHGNGRIRVRVNPKIINTDQQLQAQAELQAQLQEQLQAQLEAQRQRQAEFQAQVEAQLQKIVDLL